MTNLSSPTDMQTHAGRQHIAMYQLTIGALIGSGKGGNVNSARWQVTLCDPIWLVSSFSSEACC